MRRGLALVALTAVVAVASAVTFPEFRQCDPAWGQDEMGVNGNGERATICKEGCAMSCVSMALNGYGVDLNGKIVTPGSLNAWLEANAGYECLDGDCNNLVLSSIDKASGGKFQFQSEAEKPSEDDLRKAVQDGSRVFVAHVHHNSHFVLLTSWNDSRNAYNVHDPFYPSQTYPYSNISDVIVYNVKQEETAIPDSAVIPFQYPLYKQCDPRWGNDTIETTTVCAVGCLMSSTSMAIGGKDLTIDGAESNPGTLNTWLRGNGGYTQGNDLIESVVPKINPAHISWPSDAMHTTNDIPYSGIITLLKQGRPVIANVLKGTHFVLVIGWDADSDTLYINDPGFTRNTYSYKNDVVGWRLYNMTMSAL